MPTLEPCQRLFPWTRGGVELDPTQIVTPRVNTVERVTIAPGLCLSNFTHIVVWCAPALSAILSLLCRWTPHAHRLLACHTHGLARSQVKPHSFACMHLAPTCLLVLACWPVLACRHCVVPVLCPAPQPRVAACAGAKWRRRTLGTWPCPPQRRLRAPRRLAASCWAACERMHMRRCSSDAGCVAHSQVVRLDIKPRACPEGVHVRLDFFLLVL